MTTHSNLNQEDGAESSVHSYTSIHRNTKQRCWGECVSMLLHKKICITQYKQENHILHSLSKEDNIQKIAQFHYWGSSWRFPNTCWAMTRGTWPRCSLKPLAAGLSNQRYFLKSPTHAEQHNSGGIWLRG